MVWPKEENLTIFVNGRAQSVITDFIDQFFDVSGSLSVMLSAMLDTFCYFDNT